MSVISDSITRTIGDVKNPLSTFVGNAGGCDVAIHHRLRQFGRYIAPRILEQCDKVERRGAAHRILKVEQPDAGNAVARGQPVQIIGVVIEQSRRRGRDSPVPPDARRKCGSSGVGGDFRR